MYKRVALIAALLAAGLISVAGRDAGSRADAALQRASDDWDKGDYVSALTSYQEILAGPDAAAGLEPIALQTGELFRTTELTTDGANPVFSPDSRSFSYETGPGVAAGVASGAARVRRPWPRRRSRSGPARRQGMAARGGTRRDGRPGRSWRRRRRAW